MRGHVELAGTHTRGSTVFDWYKKDARPPNVVVVTKMDKVGMKFSCKLYGLC